METIIIETPKENQKNRGSISTYVFIAKLAGEYRKARREEEAKQKAQTNQDETELPVGPMPLIDVRADRNLNFKDLLPHQSYFGFTTTLSSVGPPLADMFVRAQDVAARKRKAIGVPMESHKWISRDAHARASIHKYP